MIYFDFSAQGRSAKREKSNNNEYIKGLYKAMKITSMVNIVKKKTCFQPPSELLVAPAMTEIFRFSLLI